MPSDDGKVTVTTNKVEIPRVGHDPIVLELPVVTGVPDRKIRDAINESIAPEKILGESLDETRAFKWADLAQDLDPKGPLARIHPVP